MSNIDNNIYTRTLNIYTKALRYTEYIEAMQLYRTMSTKRFGRR